MGKVIPLVRKLDQGRCCVCDEPTESGIVFTCSAGVPLLVACCPGCFRGDQPEGATGPSPRAITSAFQRAMRSGHPVDVREPSRRR